MFRSHEKLPEYYIPEELKKLLLYNTGLNNSSRLTEEGERFSKILEKLKNINRLELVECHYLQFLKLCLYLEEFQQAVDLKKFNLYKKKIEKLLIPNFNVSNLNHLREKPTYKYKIPIKDMDKDHPANNSYLIKVIETEDTTKQCTMKITKVCNNYIVVQAFKGFDDNYSKDKEYTIKFKMNNYSFRCCHHALSQFDAYAVKSYLFPQKINPFIYSSCKKTAFTESNNRKDRWFNNSIMDNPEQKQAVTNIINKSSLPAPYILYGPPGTGKTATLIEAICQISYKKLGKVLICTPSNAAADVLTKRLLDCIDKMQIFRVFSQSRDPSLIDEEIITCSNFSRLRITDKKSKNGLKMETVQSMHEDLSSKTIIISTLCVCSRFFFSNIKRKFSYIFIDEAGQSTEPEALVAFNMACISQSSQIVISGDPQQLGPCVRSKLAEPVLGQSILERLMQLELYKKAYNNDYNPRYITKLRRNYRSHPAIIHVSNELYYDNDLLACSTQKSFANKIFPNNFPIIFHGVDGKEEKERNSTSSYNEKEVRQALAYARYLIGKRIGDKEIKKEDVGIVTPFTLQSKYLQRQLRQSKLDEVDVGTVEIFQGQEKEVIIVSAVRSKIFMHNDREHIGSLSNPRRFNVALTRARAVLVVVGNPTVLQVDPGWRHFLQFCRDNNACRGEAFELADEQELEQEKSINTANEKGCQTVKSTDLLEAGTKIIDMHDGVIKERTNITNKSNQKKLPRSTNYRRGQYSWPLLRKVTTDSLSDNESLYPSFEYLSIS